MTHTDLPKLYSRVILPDKILNKLAKVDARGSGKKEDDLAPIKEHLNLNEFHVQVSVSDTLTTKNSRRSGKPLVLKNVKTILFAYRTKNVRKIPLICDVALLQRTLENSRKTEAILFRHDNLVTRLQHFITEVVHRLAKGVKFKTIYKHNDIPLNYANRTKYTNYSA